MPESESRRRRRVDLSLVILDRAVRRRDPYGDALAALSDWAGSGSLGWGQPLATTDIAAALGLSPTPVREALARLAGEGVIEHRRGRGYYAPSLTRTDISNLYQLHAHLVGAQSLEIRPSGAVEAYEGGGEILQLERLFGLIVRQRAGDGFATELRRCAARLRPIRVVEASLGRLDLPLAMAIERGVRTGDDLAAVRASHAYHTSRMADAAIVEEVLRSRGESILQI
ncbi:GntR family transcriptional regulator [Brevundimonas nasdae]|uniref:GntR family transcriptional regulator n=1 Tax=Brevundimonas nasdae TaxID=172043 RepID=A0ABX8TJR5_9CAUL|nr:GntR family transcriptional regulator [Brevundimonas nasdae]QYC11450.1 GntR family transcriptional regulator [Brevundimonas nasdae]QYC14238.1 GntR family transcriptional regulator [Brevundimonas nasdae]